MRTTVLLVVAAVAVVLVVVWPSRAVGGLHVSLREATDVEADENTDLTGEGFVLLVAEIGNTSRQTIRNVRVAVPDHLPVDAAVADAPNRDATHVTVSSLLWPVQQLATSQVGWNAGRLEPGEQATVYLAVEAAYIREAAVRAAASGVAPVTVDLTGPVLAPSAIPTIEIAAAPAPAITAGAANTCVLGEAGTVRCWGSDLAGLSSPPAAVFRVLTSGGGSVHTCGLEADGRPVCWPRYEDGRASLPEGLHLVDIAAGNAHTCGLEADGTPVCWGDDEHGQASPPHGLRLTSIAAGEVHTCGLTAAGTPVCWGDDGRGQASPPHGLRLTAIVVGNVHTCGLQADGEPACWGYEDRGRLAPAEGVRLTSIAAGTWHSCGLEDDGSPVCWGHDDYGQSSPPDGIRLISIATGARHSCGLQTTDATPVCWGDDERGRATAPVGLWDDVVVTVTWEGDADLDLHVRDPDGERLSFDELQSESGGVHAGDVRPGCGDEGPHEERVRWPPDQALPGRYHAYVRIYETCEVPGEFHLDVRVDGREVSSVRGTTAHDDRTRITEVFFDVG